MLLLTLLKPIWRQRSENGVRDDSRQWVAQGTAVRVPFPAGFWTSSQKDFLAVLSPTLLFTEPVLYRHTLWANHPVAGICTAWIQAQQGTVVYVALTLRQGCITSLSIPGGPCRGRCGGPANPAQGTLFLWPISFPHFTWLCPFSLHPSPLSAFYLSLTFSSQMVRTLMCCHYVYGASWGL